MLTAARLAAFYAAYFAAVGVMLPYLPVWLQSRGADANSIGLILACSIAVRAVSGPVMAHWADRTRQRKTLMVLLAAAATGSFSLFNLAEGVPALLAVAVLFGFFWSPMMPLGESLTLLTAREEGLDYARIRLWGSLAFIATAFLGGWWLSQSDESVILWLSLALIGAMFLACVGLPDRRPADVSSARWPIWQVLRDREFLLFMLAGACIQGSHAVYYAFGTIHWRAIGLSEDVIGALWAEGVIAEVIFFLWARPLIRRLGPMLLVAAAGLAGVIRWSATGLTDDLSALVVFQALHALTFGAAHLGAMYYIVDRLPPALSASGQSVYASVVLGIGSSLAIVSTGPLYEALGGAAYLPMAALAALGAAVALVLARRARAAPASG